MCGVKGLSEEQSEPLWSPHVSAPDSIVSGNWYSQVRKYLDSDTILLYWPSRCECPTMSVAFHECLKSGATEEVLGDLELFFCSVFSVIIHLLYEVLLRLAECEL